MTNKKPSEKSLKNLELGYGAFKNKDLAREAQKKAIEKRKQNKAKFTAYKEIAIQTLNKMLSDGKTFQELVSELMSKKSLETDVKLQDVIKVMEFLLKYSGQEPIEKVEMTSKDYKIIVQNEADKQILEELQEKLKAG